MLTIEAIDQGCVGWIQGHRTPFLDAVMPLVTRLGDNIFLAIITSVAALVFWWRKERRAALLLVAVAFLSFGLTEGVKPIVRRPRPEPPIPLKFPPLSSFSYPSGHSLGSAAVYGAIALLATRRMRSKRLAALILVVAGLLVLLVGFSRIYLGVHYLSDVVGGFAAGFGCALVCFGLDRPILASAQPENQNSRKN